MEGKWLPLLAAACVVLAPREAPCGGREASGEAVLSDPRLKADVDAAVAKGAAWLRAQQAPDGTFPAFEGGTLYAGLEGAPDTHVVGITALSLLALLHCDVPPTDPGVVNGFKVVREALRDNDLKQSNYDIAVAMMAVEAPYLVRRGRRVSSKGLNISSDDFDFLKKMADVLLKRQHPSGGWRYTDAARVPQDWLVDGRPAPGLVDVSCTHYALLGLKSADRCRVPLPTEPFVKAARFLMEIQERDGPERPRAVDWEAPSAGAHAAASPPTDRARGWSYHPNDAKPHLRSASGSMTAAAVASLLVCRAQILESKTLKRKEKREILHDVERAIFDGLAWLDKHFAMDANYNLSLSPEVRAQPQPTYQLGYYLYAMERVAVFADLETIGPGHNWYEAGARFLVDAFRAVDGKTGFWEFSYAHAPPRVHDTPHALLFLRKASVRIGYPIGEAAGKRYTVGEADPSDAR